MPAPPSETLPLAIIAGRVEEAQQYAHNALLKTGDWFFVYSIRELKGRERFEYALIGTFTKRNDFLPLMEYIKSLEKTGKTKKRRERIEPNEKGLIK